MRASAVTNNNALHDLLMSCDYEPIGDYALIGDCRSAALVSRSGSIDWLCLPHFSAPSVFAAILDRERGGRFLMRPRGATGVSRQYVGASAVLATCFQCGSGAVTLTDFMPWAAAVQDCTQRLVRIVECTAGEAVVDVIYQPRPDYARTLPAIAQTDAHVWRFGDGDADIVLQADRPLELLADDDLVAGTWHLAAGERATLVFGRYPRAADAAPTPNAGCVHVEDTLRAWHAWRERWTYNGPFPKAVLRSCLTLKLLDYHHTGAVIAAPTTSLPESFAAGRNWDYRYCWLRDTSLLLQSFVDLGFAQESADFLAWLLKVSREPRLRPLYGLDGQPAPAEIVLPHLEGYRGRAPVRVGNAANEQLQLDIYGEVMQTAYRFVTRGGTLTDGAKALLASLGDAVCQLWREPDQSIWETRNPPRHYTYSKLMCWVALDRLVEMHRIVPLGIDPKRIRQERDAIRDEIERRGFDAKVGSYVGFFGGTAPDASLLLMLRYGYSHAGDPRLQGTYRYIADTLSVNGFLYRYPPGETYDGVAGPENLFAVCSFWEVDYLARAGKVDDAVRLFERLLTLANDVGLYAEQFDAATRAPLGNFPQAFSHSGLITAALAIDQAMHGKRGVHVPT